MNATAIRSTLAAPLRDQPWLYYLGYALGRAAPIMVLPLVAHAVGVSGFGRFEVALALVTTVAIIFDAGMGASIVRYARDPRFRRREVVGAASTLQFAAATAGVVLFAPLVIAFAPSGMAVTEILAVMALYAMVESYAVIGSSILRSDRRDRLFFYLSVLRLAVTAGVGGGLAFAIGPVGALIGVACGGVGFAWVALREWARSRTTGSAEVRRMILRYGLPLMATTLGMWTLAVSDRLFLQSYVSPSELGDYAANYRLGTVVVAFVAAPLILAWIPEAQRTPADELRYKRREWTWVFCGIAGSVAALSTAISPFAVPLLFGDNFNSQPYIVALVAASGCLAGLYYLATTPLLLSDSTKPLVTLALGSVVTNLALNFALIPPAGGLGAAVATACSYAALWLGGIAASRRRTARTETS